MSRQHVYTPTKATRPVPETPSQSNQTGTSVSASQCCIRNPPQHFSPITQQVPPCDQVTDNTHSQPPDISLACSQQGDHRALINTTLIKSPWVNNNSRIQHPPVLHQFGACCRRCRYIIRLVIIPMHMHTATPILPTILPIRCCNML